MTSVKDFFSNPEQEEIKQVIQLSELDTSGEIRVHIEKTCPGEVMERAAYVFKQLKMQKTRDRNGVLIYLAVNNRKFAIIGDVGINEKVGANFWDEIKHDMLTDFRQADFTKGLCNAIHKAGEQLKQHFPYYQGDVNELSDDISFGK
ncbi:MAG: TPM domain-containing protein [Bacteroidota bacterium]